MSGNEARQVKSSKPRLLYMPLALEVFISFIPFMLLVVWCMNGLLDGLTNYKGGLSWITMVRRVEKEACLFEDMMKDDALSKVDYAHDYQEITKLASNLEGTGNRVYEIGRTDGESQSDDILIRYLFYNDRGDLMALNPMKREFSVVHEDTGYFMDAADALDEGGEPESMRRLVYERDEKNYYGCLLVLEPTKPVCCGNMLMSDGKEGSRILIAGEFNYDEIEKNAGLDKKEVKTYGVLIIALLAVIVCFVIFWALRRLRNVIYLMLKVCDGNTDHMEVDFVPKSKLGVPEIRELLENFQLMFLSIRKYQDNLSDIREIYEPLLPAAFLALFGREDIREIQPGDKAIVRGSVLSVQFISSNEMGKMLIRERNALICQTLECLTSNGWIVTELEYDEISALRTVGDGVPSGARLEAVMDKIRLLNRTGSGVDEILVAGTKGEFCYTVTGTRKHMAIRMEQLSVDWPEEEGDADEDEQETMSESRQGGTVSNKQEEMGKSKQDDAGRNQ
ncbi:MAG: hypothetical protein Q4A32_01725 [Lachnospiraceae bacterium]|nr:hypothetical protein [Lachnospiraceae bacterium]